AEKARGSRARRLVPQRPGLRDELLERDLPADDLVAGDPDDALASTPQLVQTGVLARTLERNLAEGRHVSIRWPGSRNGDQSLHRRRLGAGARERGDTAVPRRNSLLHEGLQYPPALRTERSGSLEAGEK